MRRSGLMHCCVTLIVSSLLQLERVNIKLIFIWMHESCAAVSVAPAGLRHQTEEASFLFKLIFKTKLVFYILSFFF